MEARPGGDGRCGIGARLRAARERAGLTQLQAAERLHVDAGIVEALEGEDFEALGAPVFVRGHLRRYAELVRESPAELLELHARCGQVESLPDLTRIPKAERPADPRRLLVPGLGVLIAVALAGSVWWVLNLPPASPPAAATGTPDAAPPAASAPEAPDAVRPAADTQAGAVAVPTQPVATTLPAASPAAISSPAPDGTGQAVADATPAPSPTAAVQPAPTREPRELAVTLRFAADSWVEIYDARGERLYYDMASGGSERTVRGEAPLRVVLGYVPGVSLEIDGVQATIPPNAIRGDAAHIVIDRTGRIFRARRASAAGRPQ